MSRKLCPRFKLQFDPTDVAILGQSGAAGHAPSLMPHRQCSLLRNAQSGARSHSLSAAEEGTVAAIAVLPAARAELLILPLFQRPRFKQLPRGVLSYRPTCFHPICSPFDDNKSCQRAHNQCFSELKGLLSVISRHIEGLLFVPFPLITRLSPQRRRSWDSPRLFLSCQLSHPPVLSS
ncbi:hypothetical protein L209DRAFT_322498 [Thermothelomyces heterothallicus CBS 203.75]